MKKTWTKLLPAIVDKVSLAAMKDSAQEKAEKEKREKEISNALREKELAKKSSEKWRRMQKIRRLTGEESSSGSYFSRETVSSVCHFRRNRVR